MPAPKGAGLQLSDVGRGLLAPPASYNLPLPSQPSRRLFLLLWLSYAFFVVYVTTLPFDFDPSIEHARGRIAGVSRDPFVSADGSRASLSDMLQNVVLF